MTSSPKLSDELQSRINSWQENVMNHHYRLPNQYPFLITTKSKSIQPNPCTLSTNKSSGPKGIRTGLQEVSVSAINQVPRKRKRDIMAGKPNKKLMVHDERELEIEPRYGGVTTRSSTLAQRQEPALNPPSKPSTRSQQKEQTATSPSKLPLRGRHVETPPRPSVSSPSRPGPANAFQSPAAFSSPSEPLSAKEFSAPHFSPPSTPSRQPSPKRSVKLAQQPFAESEIDVAYLQTCNPPVYKYTVKEFLKAGFKLPRKVEDLSRKIEAVDGCIPSELKDDYGVKSSCLLPSNETPYSHTNLQDLKARMDQIVEMSMLYDHYPVHERQWGVLVCLFLSEVQLMSQQRFMLLNVESTPIQPDEMRPRRANNAPIIPTDQKSEQSANTRSASDRIARMVDWSCAFRIPREEGNEIKRAMTRIYPDRLVSLNQSTTWIRDFPLLFDIEVKKTNQPQSPEVQLAVWIAGALLKKRVMCWDRSMPMPGITVEGSIWRMYLFFELDEKLMMLGPTKMGDTSEIAGVWSVLYHLYLLIEWGTTGAWYRWYQKYILGGARITNDG